MKKEEIIALGIDAELAQKVADASAEELKGYVPKARFDEVNEAKKKAEEMLGERDGQLDKLKKSAGDNEDLKNQIAELQKTNAATIKQHEAEMKQLRRVQRRSRRCLMHLMTILMMMLIEPPGRSRWTPSRRTMTTCLRLRLSPR